MKLKNGETVEQHRERMKARRDRQLKTAEDYAKASASWREGQRQRMLRWRMASVANDR